MHSPSQNTFLRISASVGVRASGMRSPCLSPLSISDLRGGLYLNGSSLLSPMADAYRRARPALMKHCVDECYRARGDRQVCVHTSAHLCQVSWSDLE